ncbi:MAG TPA: hypothetical protein VF444_23835 [Pseudonocardiaceae bacterium]
MRDQVHRRTEADGQLRGDVLAAQPLSADTRRDLVAQMVHDLIDGGRE